MPKSGPHSCARLRHIWCTAALDVLYAVQVKPRLAIEPDMDAIMTRLPLICRVRQKLAAVLAVTNAPATLRWRSVVSLSSSEVCRRQRKLT